MNGAPGEIRTPDLTLRRRSLYPAELRARSLRIPHFRVSGPLRGLQANRQQSIAVLRRRVPLLSQLLHHRLDKLLGAFHAGQHGLQIQRRF